MSIKQKKMKEGRIKWYDPTRGFGFIAENDSKQDYFFHRTQVNPGVTIQEGALVMFETQPDERGEKAVNIKKYEEE